MSVFDSGEDDSLCRYWDSYPFQRETGCTSSCEITSRGSIGFELPVMIEKHLAVVNSRELQTCNTPSVNANAKDANTEVAISRDNGRFKFSQIFAGLFIMYSSTAN